MKRSFKVYIDAVSYFFNFRKPTFREFNCIDLVAGNNLLFLMAWDIVDARNIVVNPGGHVYHRPAGGVVIKLLPSTTSVDISIRNCWRRTLVSVPLQHLILDNESLSMLASDIRVLNEAALINLKPEGRSNLLRLNIGRPETEPFYCQTNINPKFNYQNLNRDES